MKDYSKEIHLLQLKSFIMNLLMTTVASRILEEMELCSASVRSIIFWTFACTISWRSVEVFSKTPRMVLHSKQDYFRDLHGSLALLLQG